MPKVIFVLHRFRIVPVEAATRAVVGAHSHIGGRTDNRDLGDGRLLRWERQCGWSMCAVQWLRRDTARQSRVLEVGNMGRVTGVGASGALGASMSDD